MPPLSKLTTKAREALRRAHELAIERGQNHVNPLHLLAALVLQEESIVTSILDKLQVDTILLTDSLLEAIEGTESGQTLSASYQIYLTPELAQAIEASGKQTSLLNDEFVSTEHLFLALLDVPSPAKDLLIKFYLCVYFKMISVFVILYKYCTLLPHRENVRRLSVKILVK